MPSILRTFYLKTTLLFLSILYPLGPFHSVYAGGVLPDTGQTKCYNNTGEILCPAPGQPFYGQDANYQGPQPAYQVSADGLTVIDLNTGLMWQQADDGYPKLWAAAIAYCEGLSLGGYLDWRIPLRLELISIVDYGRYNPAINPVFSCRGDYWSGTEWANYPGHLAWYVDFSHGDSLYTSVTGQYKWVRCVRGGN